ncbi:glutathione S-transferase [Rhizodiscina lignyota]|uniref:Glutathione S-transferase n=1 Tax=Rhizodiscina lignyota TaxID=1504668 RepID=A0A9P4INK5_9PEZI|nr:glutathione S-transferase [Rhizodiscina lignyota]
MSSAKKQRTHPQYELLYWPGIPGRGEYIRLAFEASGVPFKDTGNEAKNGASIVVSACCDKNSTGDSDGNPPSFAPPGLRVPGEGKDGKTLFISQTPNILLYLGPKLGLAGEDEVDALYVNSLTLTALDLSNETHDTHHPVASMLYYEDQKEESLKKATDFRENRIPKFFGYFERVLKGNEKKGGEGKYMVGPKLTYADTTLWQVLDGLHFAFPNECKARSSEFPVLQKFYQNMKEEKGLKEYIESGRRLEFSNGLFRHYPELDRQEK